MVDFYRNLRTFDAKYTKRLWKSNKNKIWSNEVAVIPKWGVAVVS